MKISQNNLCGQILKAFANFSTIFNVGLALTKSSSIFLYNFHFSKSYFLSFFELAHELLLGYVSLIPSCIIFYHGNINNTQIEIEGLRSHILFRNKKLIIK